MYTLYRSFLIHNQINLCPHLSLFLSPYSTTKSSMLSPRISIYLFQEKPDTEKKMHPDFWRIVFMHIFPLFPS